MPGDPKIAQNHQKSCSRGLPESTLKKVTKNDPIRKGQTPEFADGYTLSAVFPVAQGSQKGGKKPPKMEPLGTQNHKKNRKPNTQKKHQKMDAKTIKKGAKKDYPFRAEKSPKSQKSEPWAQNVPQASRRGSQAPKIPKNGPKITLKWCFRAPQIQKLRLQTCSENRHGGGIARSALDTKPRTAHTVEQKRTQKSPMNSLR